MVSDERYVWIARWDEFQHYKSRGEWPAWIKDYTRQMTDDAYLGLTFHQRGVLQGLRLSFATARRQLLGSTSALSRRLGQRVTTDTLKALCDAGFIELVSRADLDKLLQRSSPEVEEEVEKEPLTPAEQGTGSLRSQGMNPRALGTNPRAVASREKRAEALARYTASMVADDVPTPAILDDLQQRGCSHHEALELLAQHRRPVEAA